ncbi:TPA: hypothetical protein OPJ30_004498 [Escherichia coli]|nr:hypothetical protein [Escherichia coli]
MAVELAVVAISQVVKKALQGPGAVLALRLRRLRLPVAPARELPLLRVPKCRVSQRVHGAKNGVEINF